MNSRAAPDEEPSSEARERMNFTVFLSAAFHGILLFGIGFGASQSTSEEPALEITLAAHQSALAPERADFRAQVDQLGSGTLDQDARALAPTSPFQPELDAPSVQAAQPLMPEQQQRQRPSDSRLITTQNAAETQTTGALTLLEDGSAELATPESPRLEIASLMAQLDSQVQAYAKRPRRLVLTAASTQRSDDALYLDGWRRRIETIGNLNYPDAARRQKLYGSLRLLVSILPNGSILKTEVLESSGQVILDQAALDIVGLASPYEPFPESLRAQADIVEIIRTWRFHEGNALTSY